MRFDLDPEQWRKKIAALGLPDDVRELNAEQFQALFADEVVPPPRSVPDAEVDLSARRGRVKPTVQKHFEAWLEQQTNERGIPMVREYKGIPGRQYQFDYAIPSLKIAIEYDGLNPPPKKTVAAHTAIGNVVSDSRKGNLAQLGGWLWIRVNAISLNPKGNRDGYDHVGAALAARGAAIGTEKMPW